MTNINNKIHSTKNWKILLYDAVFNYCRDYFNINNSIVIELKLNPIRTKGKSFGDINLGSKNIISIEDGGIDINISYILHEFTHIKQKLKKELKSEKSILIWKNKPFMSVSDYNKVNYETHKNLPWEAEARHNEKLVSNFYKSKYMRNLKGKDVNIDLMLL